ncbi:hypothetical protein K2173_009086 [Erythroxylum novogranatense]|uniref:Enhancer of mRNA-decapping protein 4 WD40 repeat region domain-containing protein n=1 Tax=Erythroxylum novogranatense TaxID=1862640 RepID=A0AAV8TUY6_9ROSI|nr:hypothetical protein K2173_009086 [Erythroxylum novogranatense]
MATPGNPNQNQPGGGGLDVNKLFKPSSGPMNMMMMQQQQFQSPNLSSPNSNNSNHSGGNLTTSPSFPLPSSSPPPPPYLTPSSSYPPPSGPYHNPYHSNYLSPYAPPPPPTQLRHNQHHYLNNIYPPHQQQQLNRPQPISSYPPPPPPSSVAPPLPNSSGGSVLMDMLNNQNQQKPPPSSADTITPVASTTNFHVPPPVSLGAPSQQQPSSPSPNRMLSSKLPRGRHLTGDSVVYDIDVRLRGEVQPELEVTPITKYVSDPGLLLGRQIAVNRNYICYGLKPGSIRILNVNTALRSLLRGHNQKVTDMAFFAEDVHLLASICVNGRIFVRKIDEGEDEEEKPQIFDKIVFALHIKAEEEPVHPRLCWHPHKQEILMIAIGYHILRIDITKVGKGVVFSVEEPLNCTINKLINGVQLVGKHDGQVTELSMCQWMTTRLASASADGTVKIWEDRKAVPLSILRPHDGHPVNSVAFFTAPDRPDHIILVTGGPLNREVKIWASTSEEGWLLPSDSESWQNTQTLTLKSSAESGVQDAFFNQVVALPRPGLLLLANAKKNAIYAVHIEYGPYPAATRMDYIAEFTVKMCILSLTGTSDTLPNEHIVQVYCVQTQAIQQYALELSQCLPTSAEAVELKKTESNDPCSCDASESSALRESSHRSNSSQMPIDMKSSATTSHTNVDSINDVPPPLPLSPRLSRKLSGLPSPKRTDLTPQLSDPSGDQLVFDYLVDHGMDAVRANLTATSASADYLRNDTQDIVRADITKVPESPSIFKRPTHLVTPSEFLPQATSGISRGINVGEVNSLDVVINNDNESVAVEGKVRETGKNKYIDVDLPREIEISVAEKKEKPFYSQASNLSTEMAREYSVEVHAVGGIQQTNECSVNEVPDRSNNGEVKYISKDVTGTLGDLETVMVEQTSPAPTMKGRKQKGKNSQLSGPSSPSTSPFNSTDSSNEPGCCSGALSIDAALPQLSAMQDTLDQLMSIQKEMLKQMHSMISAPVSKESKRLEASLGRNIEKAVKDNTDALWARFQEENVKHHKLELERTQQLTNLVTNFTNKDLANAAEKNLKKEMASVGPAVARGIVPTLEKSISLAITESFQKGVGEKALNQLEKSVSSKLEATVARQIQLQFQTSGKQALQDALKSIMEASIIPAFEMPCKAVFDQVDAAFQKGLIQIINASQQQFDSSYSPLTTALRDAIKSASSITQTLSGELTDGQRKLIAFAAANANPTVSDPSVAGINGPIAGLHETAEGPFNPMEELSRLVGEHKYEEAFSIALHRSDLSIVSWLCSQVDLHGLLSMVPLPLSQGVLLALLQQLACDFSNETSRKVEWMTEVAVAINPTDPTIAAHVRLIFEQVYQILNHQKSLPNITSAQAFKLRTLIHVTNSVLMSCK